MTEQQKIDLNAEIKGITIPKIWFYAISGIGILFTIFMMYSSIMQQLALGEQERNDIIRRIEKIEQKIGL